jgi:hypothetical protein
MERLQLTYKFRVFTNALRRNKFLATLATNKSRRFIILIYYRDCRRDLILDLNYSLVCGRLNVF